MKPSSSSSLSSATTTDPSRKKTSPQFNIVKQAPWLIYVFLGLAILGGGYSIFSNGISIGAAVAITGFLCVGFFLWNQVRSEGIRAKNALAELESSYAKISAQTASLAVSKSETDRIMETVQEGLFLVDDKGMIGEYHSRALLGIFRQDELAGDSFFNLLQRLLSEKMYNTTKDYFGLLFDATKKEKTVLKVNPLTEIEVNFTNPAGGFLNRYLGFTFRRIIDGDKVIRVFVAVRDITKQVELEKKLREAEKHKERQLDILLGIVHVAPSELAAFTELIYTELETINKTLKAEDFAKINSTGVEILRERLRIVFRSVHNIKGNAALLKLAYFQKVSGEFETKIADLIDRKRLSGDDFLPVVIAEAGLRDDLSDLQDLREKLAGLRSFSAVGQAPASNAPVSALAENLQKLVEDAARDLQKATTLSVDEFAVHTFAVGRPELVRDVLIQLTRNALAHSIEAPADRVALGKPPVATLTIRGIPPAADGYIGLAFRDDGRGLNLDSIRSRATITGLLTKENSIAASPADLARCIFAPGFSTSSTVDSHSGRGMGMDIIKTKVVDEAGGILELHSTPGQFCEFRIYLPATVPTVASA
jgi:two-component system, chemotaxis family, sensor kinase CheA